MTLLEVRDDQVDEHRAAHQEEQARGDEPDVRPLLEDVRGPRFAGDRQPRPALPVEGRLAGADAQDDRQHRDQLHDRDGGNGQLDRVDRDRDRHEEESGDVAQDLHHPDGGAGEAHLLLGDHVRDVALERSTGRIRTEREKGDEGTDGERRL